MSPARLVWFFPILASGCWSHEAYLVDRAALVAAVPAAATTTTTAIPAVRAGDGRHVLVRSSALVLDPVAIDAAPPGAVAVRSRAYSPMVTAGSVLTWVGTAISLAGTILVAATGSDLRVAGGVIALSAEPIMGTGTALWIAGAMRHPAEVTSSRSDARSPTPSESPPAIPAQEPPVSALPPLRGAALRFAF